MGLGLHLPLQPLGQTQGDILWQKSRRNGETESFCKPQQPPTLYTQYSMIQPPTHAQVQRIQY